MPEHAAPAAEPAFDAYVRMWRQLDAMIWAGKGESPEADSLRERMDPVWQRLSTEETLRARRVCAGMDEPGAVPQRAHSRPGTVYVVTYARFTDHSVRGVFTTRERADAAVLASPDRDSLEVEEFVLDEAPATGTT